MIINSDSELRSIITNLQRASVSETSWTERLSPYLEQAEENLRHYIAPLSLIESDTELMQLAMRFVAFDAWANAINAIDLVATQSGFGVVSTNTVAPASKERVAAARVSALNSADKAAMWLLDALKTNEQWQKSKQSLMYVNIFPDIKKFAAAWNITAYSLNTKGQSLFFTYHDNSDTIMCAQYALAEKLLGLEALEALVSVALTEFCKGDISFVDRSILSVCRRFVAYEVLGAGLKLDLAAIYRKFDSFDIEKSEILEVWKQSSQYKAFKSHDYENTKESSAFFF